MTEIIAVSGPIVCIGDLHGNIKEVKDVWQRILDYFKNDIENVTFVFMGDYCDRGPDTKAVIQWLIDLKKCNTKIFCLAGNHDFGMAAFLGLIEIPEEHIAEAENNPFFFDEKTRNPCFKQGFWGHETNDKYGMHYYGRRWGNLTTFDAISTLRSYGVSIPGGNRFINKQPNAEAEKNMRKSLQEMVPKSHQDFLRSLDWVIEINQNVANANNEKMIRKLIMTHAGLHGERSMEDQVNALKARNFLDPMIIEDTEKDPGRVTALNSRICVYFEHPDVVGSDTVLVSGHHGCVYNRRNRVIIDSSGGNPGQTIQAVVFDICDVSELEDTYPII